MTRRTFFQTAFSSPGEGAAAASPPAGGPQEQAADAALAQEPAIVRAAAASGRIGDRFIEAGRLTAGQVDRIMAHQAAHGLRFGEAAVDLGLLSEHDIQTVLSAQYNYANALVGHPAIDAMLAIAHAPFSPEAEAIRQIRAELSIRFDGAQRVSVAIVSPGQGDGKSYLAASLAIAFSQSGLRTLLVNANLRGSGRRELITLPGQDPVGGLSSMLSGRTPASPGLAVPGFPLLHVLSAGPQPPNPTEILGEPALRRLLAEVGADFDMVIVDTPAAKPSSDAQIIARQCSACLLLGRQDQTPLQDLLLTRQRMLSTGVRMMGTVYNSHAGASAPAQRPGRGGWRTWLRMTRKA